MAAKIVCRNCGADIPVEAVSPGRVVMCASCGAENLMPINEVNEAARRPEKPGETEAARARNLRGATREPVERGEEKEGTTTAVIFRQVPDMKKDLRNWGIGLILIGIVSIVFSGILDPVWGGTLIVLGVISLLVAHRGMYIVIGIGLLLAGVMNIRGVGWPSVWVLFGLFQLFLGILEIRKFWRYA